MNIGALSVSMSTASTSQSMSILMLDKVLDTAEETSDLLTEMMESVTIPGLGEHIDIRA